MFACAAIVAVSSAVDVKQRHEDLEPAAGTLGIYGGRGLLGGVYGYSGAAAGLGYAQGLGFAGAAGLGYAAGVGGFGAPAFAYGGGLPLHYGGARLGLAGGYGGT
jgi:hypothetical protein